MQPNQAPPAPPPYNPKAGEKNPYDFLEDRPAPKKSLLPNFGGGSKQRLLFLGGIGVVVLLIFAILFSIVFGGAPSNKDQLLSLAQEQNELIRVADIGDKKARDAQARNLAMTAKLMLQTDQQPLLTSLKSQKVKVNGKQLAAGKNAKTDETLTQAEQANRFDEVFIVTLQTQLTKYQKDLKAAYDNEATGKKLKATLSTQYKNASLIIDAKPEL